MNGSTTSKSIPIGKDSVDRVSGENVIDKAGIIGKANIGFLRPGARCNFAKLW